MIIFQHLPKTASTSISNAIPNSVRHGEKRLNKDLPNKEVISFTIIRDPLDRFVSGIKQFMSYAKMSQDDVFDIAITHNYTNEDLASGIIWSNIRPSIALHTLSMFHDYLNVFDKDKIPKSKYLIEFNNFQEELSLIIPNFNSYKIKKMNVSTLDSIRLTKKQKLVFEEKYHDDIVFYEKFQRIKNEDKKLLSSFFI